MKKKQDCRSYKNLFQELKHQKARRFSESNVSKQNVIGYCNYIKHRGPMSLRMVKDHNCLTKNCPHFVKADRARYWIKKDIIKALKVYRKHGTGFIQIGDKYFVPPDTYRKGLIDSLYSAAEKSMKETGIRPMILYMNYARQYTENEIKIVYY